MSQILYIRTVPCKCHHAHLQLLLVHVPLDLDGDEEGIAATFLSRP